MLYELFRRINRGNWQKGKAREHIMRKESKLDKRVISKLSNSLRGFH